MKTTTQYQPNWSEQNHPRPRDVMWLEPENPQEYRILDKLAKNCTNAWWTGIDRNIMIITFYDDAKTDIRTLKLSASRNILS